MKKLSSDKFIQATKGKHQRMPGVKRSVNWNLLIGSVLVVLVLLMAVVGLFYTPYPVNEMNVLEKNQAPSFAHFFGTDQFGRDIFSRVMEGASTSFLIAVCVVLVGAGVGTFVGSVLGSIMSNITYGQLVQTMELNHLSDEQRKRIEEYCKTLIEEELYYRERMNTALTNYLNTKESNLTKVFNELSFALQNNESLTPALQSFSNTLDLGIKIYDENEVADIVLNQKAISI